MSTTDRQYHETYRLDSIRLNGDTHARAKLDLATVREYAEAIEAGAELPPLLVFFDGTNYWLADGFHRWHAYDQAGVGVVHCLVRKGSRKVAQWVAIAANQTHGLRRSNADKAVAVRRAIGHPDAADLSNGQIAEHVGVSEELVRKHRKALEADGSLPTVGSRTGRDGRTIDVSRIGRTVVKDPADDEPSSKDLEVEPAGNSDRLACPNCGSTDFHDDGDCGACLEPCAHLVGCDATAESETSVSAGGATEGTVWQKVETIVGSWLAEHPEDKAVAAARLENLAVNIRSSIGSV